MSFMIDCTNVKGEASESPIAEEKLISGTPVATVHGLYENAEGKFFVGYWSSTPGKWRVNYDEEEYFEFLEGEAIIEGDEGERYHCLPGTKLVIKAGFKGTWETVKACRKLYVIALT